MRRSVVVVSTRNVHFVEVRMAVGTSPMYVEV